MIAANLNSNSYIATLYYVKSGVPTRIALENCTKSHFSKIPSNNKRLNQNNFHTFMCIPLHWTDLIGGDIFGVNASSYLYL